MKKKGQVNVAALILMAMGIIVALVILQQVFSSQTAMTTKSNIVNETLSLSGARSGTGTINTSYYFNLANGCPETIGNWRLSGGNDCDISVTRIYNATGSLLTVNTDYVVNNTAGAGLTACTSSAGDIRFLNTLAVNNSGSNTTYVTYTYCADGYSTDSASRQIGGIIGLLSAIALIIFVAYMGLRDYI